MGPSDRHFSRVGTAAAVLGLSIYAGSAILHPWAPPHETRAAFAEYAAEANWALIHLGELTGILLMAAAGIALAWRLRQGVSGVWALMGAAAMSVFVGVYAMFAAVDGVALGIMVDRWITASAEQRELLFETAFAVRQIEAGLFSLQWFMFGIAAACFAVAFFVRATKPYRLTWSSSMGWLSAFASLGTLSFAISQAINGFSPESMALQVGLYPGVVWILAVGLFLYRRPIGVGRAHSTAPS